MVFVVVEKDLGDKIRVWFRVLEVSVRRKIRVAIGKGFWWCGKLNPSFVC